MSTEITQYGEAEIDEALTRAWLGASKHKIKVKERTVRTKLVNLCSGAKPGGSMCWNDVLLAIGDVKGGAKRLRE